MADVEAPRLIEGGLAVDDRGSLSFVNGFDFQKVKRFYIVSNHSVGFVRAWHGHKKESKYLFMAAGAALVGAVKIDDWKNPSPSLPVQRFVLSAQKPAMLYIPPGYANGFLTLSADARMLIFSNSSLEDSLGDDFRFDARLWDPWKIVER